MNPRSRPGQLAATLALLLILSVVASAQAVYYFDQNGGNDGNAGTQAAPKASITWLNANAGPGDICLLEAGDTFPTQLRPTSPDVTVASYGPANGGRATIEVAGSTCVWIDQQGILLKDLEITGGTNGIYLDGTDTSRFTAVGVDSHSHSVNGLNTANLAGGATGDGILLINGLWRDNGGDGAGVRGTIQARVIGGSSTGNGDDGLSCHENSRLDAVGVEVSGNVDGILHVHSTGSVLVDRCWVHSNVGGDAVSFSSLAAPFDGELIVRNSVLAVPAAGAGPDNSCADVPAAGHLVVTNCTLQNLNATGNNAYCVLVGGTADATVTNNVMLGADSARAWMTKLDTSGEIRLWDRNAYQVGFAGLAAPFRIGGGGVHTFEEWRTLSGADKSSIAALDLGVTDSAVLATDPLGALPTAASVLVGRGRRLGHFGPIDYAGVLRSFRIDLGALQFDGDLPTYSTKWAGDSIDWHDDRSYVARRVPVGTTPTYVDLTSHIASVEGRVAGGGTRLVMTCNAAATVKFRLGFGHDPADVGEFGEVESGVVIHTFPTRMPEIRTGRPITSIDIISSVSLSGEDAVAVTLYR